MGNNYLSDVIALLTLEKKREMSFDTLVRTIQLKRSQLEKHVPTGLVTARVRAAIASGKDMGLIRTVPYNIERGIEKAKLAFAMPEGMGNMSRNATALISASSSEDLSSEDLDDLDKIIQSFDTTSEVKVDGEAGSAQASTSHSSNTSKRSDAPDNQGEAYSSDGSGSNDESQDSEIVKIPPTVAAYTHPYYTRSKEKVLAERQRLREIKRMKLQARIMRRSDPR